VTRQAVTGLTITLMGPCAHHKDTRSPLPHTLPSGAMLAQSAASLGTLDAAAAAPTAEAPSVELRSRDCDSCGGVSSGVAGECGRHGGGGTASALAHVCMPCTPWPKERAAPSLARGAPAAWRRRLCRRPQPGRAPRARCGPPPGRCPAASTRP
jgi:hypothetical protein